MQSCWQQSGRRRAGKIEQVGKPLELYNRPCNKFVAGFLGAPQMNFLSGNLAPDGTLTMDCGLKMPVRLGETLSAAEKCTLGLRPETIGVSLEGAGDMTVKVQNFEQLGAVTYIYTVFANGETLTVQLAQQIPLRRGQDIGVTFDPTRFHIFAGEGERALLLHGRADA